ncbi:MAG: FAD-dependent oxidoreductase [Gammaproteobacteria bacterium]|nr:FAD-dependent oxidoreductase [Gammaproteobacteria bacterium]
MDRPGTQQIPLRVAVVGSGPSGFYAAESLLKSEKSVKVDVLERLPIPYGLVRSGVAPDHPKLKQVIEVYAGIAESPHFTFVGNVTVGRDISIDDLRASHHAVIIACGAETDRHLGVPGENLPGSHTATEFVGWYNGHPDFRDRSFDLSHETAVVIGQGNVAADVARILAKTHGELQHTDIADHALEALSGSRIRNILVVGRRGPAQAKFTSKELKEFGELVDCDPVVEKDELTLNASSEAELAEKSNAGTKKVYEIFSGFSARPPAKGRRRVQFTFLKSPRAFLGQDRVEKIVLERNELTGEPFRQSARGTGQLLDVETGLVFRSIGYRGIPLPGVPFDEKNGIIPNAGGRVLQNGSAVPQLYATGWIKRGPTGIIGTNRADSVATVSSLLEDLARLGSDSGKRGAEGIYGILDRRGIRYVSFADWKKIDAAEIERGRPRSKPREKFTSVGEMLAQLD